MVRVPICSTSYRRILKYHLNYLFRSHLDTRKESSSITTNVHIHLSFIYIQFNRELQITHPIVCEKKKRLSSVMKP
jgi:hypothetical protein